MSETIGTILAVLLFGPSLLLLGWYRPVLAVFVVSSLAALLDCLQIGLAGVDVGVNLYIDDAACFMIMLWGALTLVRSRKRIPRDVVPCLFLLVLTAISLERGISSFGLKSAGNGVRNLLTFLTPA